MASHDPRPTRLRVLVIGLTTCVAVLLYVDRFCLGFVAPYIRESLGLSRAQVGFALDAFFFTYAFGQVPCGWLSDRFGPRLMLAIYLGVWSALTGLMGFAQGLTALVLFRLGCGLFEAGAYPASAGLIRRWIPYQNRGLASGIVSIGGRVGGAVVPVLTAYLMVSFVPVSVPSRLSGNDILEASRLALTVAPGPAAPQPADAEPTLADLLAPRVRAVLSPEARALLARVANAAQAQLERLAVEANGDVDRAALLEKVAVPLTDAERTMLAEALNALLSRPDLISSEDVERFRAKLPPEVRTLSASAAPDAVARRNRLVLEAAYPVAVRKIYGEGWRPALWLYGGLGLGLALVFWLLVRDTPRQHPWANEAEARQVETSDPPTAAASVRVPPALLWKGIVTSRSLWLSAFVQFGTNFGWIFLGNLFPTYLKEVHRVSELERGWYVSLPFMVSLPMMIVGGWWTDRLTRRIGARWGRALPLALTRLIAASAFLMCLLLDAPLPITLALCVFSLASDMGLPSIWAYCLDVGGRNVGVVLAWGNMWGNLGAAVSTTTLLFLQRQFGGDLGWDAVFLTCGLVFLVIGVASFGIDATRPIVPAAPDGATADGASPARAG